MIILLLSLLGFTNAFYLYYQHVREVKTGQKMFCFIGGDCGAVVGSKYGKTLGIKNELWGMGFYALLAVYSFSRISNPTTDINFTLFIKLLTIIAAAFSLYLLFLQTIVLNKFCSWCLLAIIINLLIFWVL